MNTGKIHREENENHNKIKGDNLVVNERDFVLNTVGVKTVKSLAL